MTVLDERDGKQEVQGPAFCKTYLEGTGPNGGSVCGALEVEKLSLWQVWLLASCWLRCYFKPCQGPDGAF